MKLCAEGNATIEQCKVQWNYIVAKHFENSGTMDYIGYLDNIEGYNSFLQEHNVTISQLIILHFQVDNEIIYDLVSKGYTIDLSGKLAYRESLEKAMNRSKHLLSRIKIQANQLDSYSEGAEDYKPSSFDEVMASLIFNLGFTVPDNISLSRYNQYRKIIDQKRKLSVTEI